MATSRRLSTFSWAFYDFANTVFSAVVLTFYFPLYLTELTGRNWQLGAATTGSMILAGVFVPFLGALSDQTGKTKTYLIRTTLIAIAFLFPLFLFKTPALLIFSFLIACFFYHASLVFYNSLLPTVASPEQQGRVSGLGTGLGYLGVVCSLPIAEIVAERAGTPPVFLVAGLLYLLFSLPLFFFVPERKVPEPAAFHWGLWKTEWSKFRQLFKKLPQQPHLLLFLGGNFFVVDALNSMIFWFMVYAREVFDPGQAVLTELLIGVNIAAFVFGIITGFLTDRLGSLQTMLLSSLSLTVGLVLISWVETFTLFAAVSLFFGAFAISGIWTAGRKTLVEMVPKEELGEYFGVYGLTTKISVLGSLFFSILADLNGFREAIWILVFPATVGLLCLFFSYRIWRR